MKKTVFIISLLAATTASAQSSLDLFTASSNQLRGTARYISMSGAFGALGGDISTLTQNPAGIGVYRSSEISATMDIDGQRNTLRAPNFATLTNTHVACDNFGYVGAINLGSSSVMPYFQWGATYNRLNSYERSYRGYFPMIGTSWTNYIAEASNGYAQRELFGTGSYDPFYSSGGDWLSILSYNTMLINPNPLTNRDGDYVGLFQGSSTGNAEVDVHEQGYIDEYSINFGGNFSDIIYWGIGFGIRDLNFTRYANYNEQISNAWVPVDEDPVENTGYRPANLKYGNGAAEWGIDTYQHVTGTGFNVKLGLIFKPVNEFRLGLAVHTPTWYKLDFQQSAKVDFRLGNKEADGFYTFDNYPGGPDANNPYASTGDGYYNKDMKTPWRLMASAAGVLGGRFILSADYIYEAYPSMGITNSNDPQRENIAADVKQYYKGSNELRLGAELRVTPKFSIRAGYGLKSSSSKSEAYNNENMVYTSGVSTMYTFEGDRQNVSFGIGYRLGQFYFDAAYIHTMQTSQWSAFTPFPKAAKQVYSLVDNAERGPSAQLQETHNRFALTVGFKF